MSQTVIVSVFWTALAGSLALLVYTYVGYPLLATALAAIAKRPASRESVEPTVSFIILALNEEAGIGDKLQNTLGLDYPPAKLEVVVASDGSTDRTDEIVAGYADRGVRLFRVDRHRGKTETTNRVVPTTSGEILVFSDATGRFNRDCIRRLVGNFADSEVGAVVGRVEYRYGPSLAAQGFKGYQRYVVSVRRKESAFGTGTTASGSICAIRRELFRTLRPDLDFDMAHPLHVAQSGKRTAYEPRAVSVEQAREKLRGEFGARVRMAIQAFSFLPYLARRLPSCRNRMYVFQVLSLKVLRWISPFLLLVLLASSAALASDSPVALALLVLQLVVYLAAATACVAGRVGHPLRPLALALFFTTINLAFLVGFAKWLGGTRIAGWSPER